MNRSRSSIGILAGLAIAGAMLFLLGARRASAAQDAAAEAREAQNRFKCVNNLKEIMLAFHNYESTFEYCPGDIVGKDGKPLLSWRVAILPFLDELELYKKFKLDEPWDSAHNKPLLKEMPKVLQCPSRPGGDPTETHYLGFSGPGALFEPGKKIGIAYITDGTSNTLAVVEAEDGAPWTKPADLPFDPKAEPSLCGAGSKHPECFNAVFADGSARSIKTTIDPTLLRAFITRNSGEVVVQGDAPTVGMEPRRGSTATGEGPGNAEARNRARCVNNLKQIGLALHNYHDTYNHFPGNIVDTNGEPLLSWRVAILPFVDHGPLYKAFKLDEPWDSPHNKPLLEKMPEFLRCPSRPQASPTETHYLGFEGPGALFEKGKKVGIASIIDGTSNTLAVLEAEEGAPWTKPADLPFDPEAPPSLHGAASKHPGGFEALLLDGSVHFIKATINPTIFRALITRAGGEVLPRGSS